MVDFRPHKLRVIKQGAGAYSKSGDWEEGTPVYSDYIPCRYEPNGAANTISLPDGDAYRYSYIIYLSVNPSLSIKYGDKVELTSQDGIVIAEALEVKGFHRGQLDMKVWV